MAQKGKEKKMFLGTLGQGALQTLGGELMIHSFQIRRQILGYRKESVMGSLVQGYSVVHRVMMSLEDWSPSWGDFCSVTIPEDSNFQNLEDKPSLCVSVSFPDCSSVFFPRFAWSWENHVCCYHNLFSISLGLWQCWGHYLCPQLD